MAESKERFIAILNAVTVFFVLLAVLLRPLVCGLSGGLGANILVALPLLGAAFLWIMSMVMRQELRFLRTPMDLPVLFLVLFALASVAGAVYKHAAASVAFDWLCYVILFYMVVNLCAEMPRLGLLLLLAAMASTFVVSLNGLVQHFYSLKLTHDLFMANKESWMMTLGLPRDAIPDFRGRLETGRIFSTFLLPNTCAGFLGVMIPVQVGLLVWGIGATRRGAAGSRGRRAAFVVVNIAALLAALLCLYYTKSKGGWISLAIVVSIFAVLSGRRFVARYWAWALGALLAVVLLFAALQLTHRAPPLDEYFESFSARAQYWRAGALIIRDHPWLGVGLNNFGEFYAQYRRPQDEETLMAHNNFLQVWAETGLFGFLAFCWVWAAFFYAMRRGKTQTPGVPLGKGVSPAVTDLRLLAAFAALIGFAMIYAIFFSLERLPESAPWLFTACYAVCWGLSYFVNEATLGKAPDVRKGESEPDDAGIRLGIAFGILFFLIHSFADFDLYEQGLAQTVWLLMAIGLASRCRDYKFVRVPIGPAGQMLVALPTIIVMALFVCILAPRLIEAKVRMENGRDFLANKEDQRAISEWLTAARLDPWDSETQVALAEKFHAEWHTGVKEYKGTPTFELALSHIRRAIALSPRRARYHHLLAHLYDEMSAQQTSADQVVALRRLALPEYEQAHKLFPSRAIFAADLAFAYDAAGRHAEALPLYETALELDGFERPDRASNKLTAARRREIERRIAANGK